MLQKYEGCKKIYGENGECTIENILNFILFDDHARLRLNDAT